MSPIDAAILILVLALPLHWLVLRHFDQIEDPTYLRRHGVVITSERAIQAHSAPIGEYLGQPIWGSVTFKGMQYRFERIQAAKRREQLAAGELFLDPGLVYVTD